MEIFGFINSILESLSIYNISVDGTLGIFDSFYTVLMYDLMVPLSDKFNDVAEFIRPIFSFALGLFVSVFGYMILAGKIKAPAEEFIWRAAIISFLFWLTFSPARYEEYVVKPAMGLTTAATKIISPQAGGFFGLFKDNIKVGQDNDDIYQNNRGLFMGLDVAVESVSIILKGTVETFSTFQSIKPDPKAPTGSPPPKKNDNVSGNVSMSLLSDMLVVGFVGMIITGAVMVYVTAGAILMLNHVFLVLMLMIGPAFIVMAAYQPTREYAKRWLSRVLGIMLTIAICSAITAFILFIQKDITTQMCQATGALQKSFYNKAQALYKDDPNGSAQLDKFYEVQKNLNSDFNKLRGKVIAIGVGNTIGNGGQGAGQSFAALELIEEIIQGCDKGMGNSNASNNDEAVNIMFYAIQYLIICMILNRLVSESANVASSIVNSSGLTTGTSQEVSGGAQGMSGRLTTGAGSGNNGLRAGGG